MIRFKNVTKRYAGAPVPAVSSLNLEIKDSEFLVLLGESGCGKTSILKMINRLLEPSDGVIEVDGRSIFEQNLIEWRRSIGYVIQQIGLFPHMSIADNIMIVPRLLKWSEDQIQKRLSELFTLIALPEEEFRDRLPRELSGGQQQRVGLARALAFKPKILLMDEPLGALDPLTRDQMQQDIMKIQKQLGLTVVMVTHDMTEALLMGDQIAVMLGGEIVQQGTGQELLRKPKNDYVRNLMAAPSRHAEVLEALKRDE